MKQIEAYKHKLYLLSSYLRRTLVLLFVLIISTVPLLLINETAIAAQITSRSLLIGSAQPSANTTYTFTFTPAQTTQIQSVKIQSCTTPLGLCTAPTNINLAGGTPTESGFQGATAFTKDTTTAGCTAVDVLCITRSDTTAQTTTAHTIVDTGAVNQDNTNCASAPNCTFFERITTYSSTSYTSPVDSGTTASSTTQIYTVNAAVEEQLAFCIGSTIVDDATNAVPTCSTITGTSLNLGVLNSTNINISPVSSANQGDANNGLAELNTNASNGATVSYDAVQQPGSHHQGTLRVPTATCAIGASNSDQCIDAVGSTKGTLTAGTEKFGMTVAGVNCSNTTAYYPCTFSTGTYNLIRTTNYNCNASNSYPTTDVNTIIGTSACSYAWDESGASQTIASSSTPVGNEALILKFAATPNLITPTGSYTAQADFVAAPTY